MNKKLLLSFALASLVLLTATAVKASPSAYFNAITNLNPAGYWPMHEVEAGSPGDIETNYGTLGTLANGYYNDWSPNWTNGGIGGGGGLQLIRRQVAGPVVNPADTGAYFTNNAERKTWGGYLMVPNVSPGMQIKPPFTVEGWCEASFLNNTLSSMVSQGGGAGLNNNPNFSGWSLNWNTITFGSPSTIFNMYAFGGAGSATAGNTASVPSVLTQSNTWYYFAYVFTTNNTTFCVANGTVSAESAKLSFPMAPATWSPLFLGNGRNGNTGPNGFSFDGALSEVAIYTNVLSSGDFAAHYNAGISASPPTNYFQLVTNGNPIVYLRMNAPAYTQPDPSTLPALTNFGSVAVNGVYTPGTVPNLVTGLVSQGFPIYVTNSMPLFSGMGTFADAGNNSLYNPSGSSATFSISALFRGNPADPRVQSIVGHGTNSWMLGLTTSGRVVFNSGTNAATAAATGSAAGDLTGTATNDDGYWHYVVAVHNVTTNFLYVDGLPVGTNVTTVSIPGNAQDVMIAADPSYTNANANLGRQFSGQVCEVAFFTNALQASDVQTLYTDLGVIPIITQQPAGSNNVNAATAFTNNAVVTGSPLLSYLWYFNTNASYAGATALTDNGRIVGSATTSLVITNVHGADAGYYFVVVTNNYGSATSVLSILTVNTSPTIISQLPVPYTNLMTIYAGVNPNFSVSAAGASPIKYYWFSNSVLVAGATNASYTQTNVQVGTITNYCVMSNFLGTATSFVWTASIVPDPTAPYPQAVLALNPIGYWRLNETPDDTAGNDGLPAKDYINGNNGIYSNALIAQLGYTSSKVPNSDPTETSAAFNYVYTSDCDAHSIMGMDFATPAGTNAQFTISAWVNCGGVTGTAGIVSKGYYYGEEYDLDCGAPGNDYRFEVRSAIGTPYNANSTMPAIDNKWHHLVGVCDEANGNVLLYIDGVLAGSTPIPALSGITNSSSVPTIIGSRPTDATTGANNQFGGFVNDVAIFKYALTAAQVQNLYIASGVPPYFSQQPPTNATANAGSTLTVPAAVSGTLPITNQWWDSTANSSIAGQTNATLVISNVPSSLNGHILYLAATNLYGSTNSSLVTLTIYLGPPQIIVNLPAAVSTVVNKFYTYSVSVAGSLPLSYQWYSNNVALLNQTNSSYAFTVAGPGSYSVTITNFLGLTNSAVSLLTVVPPPTDAYATNLLNGYGAVGYWPLQETNAPAPATMETNYGSLGQLANAYYAASTASQVSLDIGGALTATGDNDPAANFNGINGATPTGYAFVPRILPALTLLPPFTLECWVNSSSSAFGDLMGEGGSGFDTPAGGGNWGGIRLSYGGNNLQLYIMDGNGSDRPAINTPTGTLPGDSSWYHCVATYDGTTANLYINAVPLASGPLSMAPDNWSPFTIGAGYWSGYSPQRGYAGTEDEVAVYTNVLTATQITNHWLAANTATSNYVQTVLADKPLLYYRMDCATYTNQSPALCPVALNFGSAPVNGYYPSGTRPGAVSGPAYPGLGGTNAVASPINGLLSCVDAGFDSSFNRTGNQPFTAMTWFKTYPSDGRGQTIMSHGLNWSLNLDGTSGNVVWTTIGNLVSTTVLNDGNWHQVAGVYDGTTSYLYVDGHLNNSTAPSGTLTSDTVNDLCLGGNAAYTLIGTNEAYFAGSIAQASFFTNALTAGQILQSYNLANPAPSISVARSGNNVTITYVGTLRSSTNVVGPYNPVSGAISPYTTPATNAQQFYRTSVP